MIDKINMDRQYNCRVNECLKYVLKWTNFIRVVFFQKALTVWYYCWRSSYQKGRVGIQSSNGEGWDPIIKRGELGSSYQTGRVGIQLSKGESWDPVIKWGGLGSNYQKGAVGIQLSNGEGWDPIIKRGELGSSYQTGKVGIQLSKGESWDQPYTITRMIDKINMDRQYNCRDNECLKYVLKWTNFIRVVLFQKALTVCNQWSMVIANRQKKIFTWDPSAQHMTALRIGCN
jgi:hypothetical protein